MDNLDFLSLLSIYNGDSLLKTLLIVKKQKNQHCQHPAHPAPITWNSSISTTSIRTMIPATQLEIYVQHSSFVHCCL